MVARRGSPPPDFQRSTFVAKAVPVPVVVVISEEYRNARGYERMWASLLGVEMTVLDFNEHSGKVKGEWVPLGPEGITYLLGVPGVQTVFVDSEKNAEREDFVRKPGRGLKRVA